MQRAIVGVVLFVLLAAICYLGAACGLQRRLLYPRPPAPATPPPLPHSAIRTWVGSSGDSEAWLLRPDEAQGRFPVVIFAHGNGELIDHWTSAFSPLIDRGIGVLLVEYPGYGRSKGAPTESSITDAMLSAYDFVVAEPEVDESRVVAFGRSLGGGAACTLALRRPIAALVLESSFTSVRSIARRFGVPGPLVLDPFDSLDAIRRIDAPVLVLHGEYDQIIPVAHGEELARASGTELVRMKCGHNDCPRPWPEIGRFFRETGILQ